MSWSTTIPGSLQQDYAKERRVVALLSEGFGSSVLFGFSGQSRAGTLYEYSKLMEWNLVCLLSCSVLHARVCRRVMGLLQ